MGDGMELATDWLAAEHEQLGAATTHLIATYAQSLDHAPVCLRATPAELESRFRMPLPRAGLAAADLLDMVKRDVIPDVMNISSPRYFGLFNPTPLPIAVWVDALVSALNQNAAAWRHAPVATVLEAQVVQWLCELLGYGDGGFGTLTSGGSEANLIALKCARDRTATQARSDGLATGSPAGPLTVYVSEQCHYSLVRSADLLGLGRANLRKIDTDADFHIRLASLEQAIEQDRSTRRRPCCVVGVAGATSTGVIDPLDRLADIAAEHDLWFHVDAAYGGGLAFSQRHRDRLVGIERADSVTIDPHKCMFVPFACGAVLVRSGAGVLREAFDISPEYLSEQRGQGEDAAFDFFRLGQLGTRRAGALTVWVALRHLGVDGYARIIDQQLDLTHHLAARLDELEHIERLGEVETAVCCARYLPPPIRDAPTAVQDQVQLALQQRVESSGRAWLATTELHGRRALRFNVNSFLTRRHHIDALVATLRREAAKVHLKPPHQGS